MSTVWVLFFAIAFFVALYKLLHYRRRLKALQASLFQASSLPQVTPPDLAPIFAQTDLGPSLESEIYFIGSGTGPLASTSDTEAWILACLAKSASAIFEFGTATGRTTYLMGRNAPEDARVVTITLPPDRRADYRGHEGDSASAQTTALNESAYDKFMYSGTSIERKVTQLFGDSKQFDETPYLKFFDLIFIDGSHAYSYVKSDSEKALRMLREGGIILWHDFRGPNHAITADVCRYLTELGASLPLRHVAGTSLVAYRHVGP